MPDSTNADAVDLFCGPGGWDLAAHELGLSVFGIDNEPVVAETRTAAGLHTMLADLGQLDPRTLGVTAEGLIASPPCPDWSAAGSKLGRDGATGWLIDIVPAWVNHLEPDWIACEQVPGALEVWRQHAELYRTLGYWVWAGKLNAADYGVPQKRIRAVLIASRTRPITEPLATHAEHPGTTLTNQELEPWVPMISVLGEGIWPAWTARPATTVCGDPRVWQPGHKVNQADRDRLGVDEANARYVDRAGTTALRLTLEQRLALQSFPPGYKVAGNKGQQDTQVGNAVPPLLARAILAEATGR